MTERRDYDLAQVRADGWFGRLAAQAPHFEQLCDAIGEKVVAFSIIAGARISSVHIDQRNRDSSLIEFSVGDDEEIHRLVLSEFRQRLVATLASLEVSDSLEAESPTSDELQSFLGFRTVLLSALFGIELMTLHVGGESPPTVDLVIGDSSEEVQLQELRAALRERVRAEAQASGEGFSIDLATVDKAEAAADEGDWARVHELLQQWLGPLSVLLRSAEGYALSPDVRDRLALSLGLLGSAYDALELPERAADCFRLGVQWAQAQGSEVQAELFVRYGASFIGNGEHGKAIGMLRRSLSLGAAAGEVFPLLAQCYAASERWLPALLCAESAVARGAEAEALADLVKEGEEKLGESWQKFRERIPAPDCQAKTSPPPGGS